MLKRDHKRRIKRGSKDDENIIRNSIRNEEEGVEGRNREIR